MAKALVIGADGNQIESTELSILSKVQFLTATSSGTPTPAINDYHVTNFDLTALAVDAVFGVPTTTGSMFNHQKLLVRIKDNGTAHALSFNSGAGGYRASSDLALPTTTILGKTLYLGFDYNSADGKWDLIALLNNF